MEQDKKPTVEPTVENESTDGGIIDPEKNRLAAEHSIPGQGDPSIRRVNPDPSHETANLPPRKERKTG